MTKPCDAFYNRKESSGDMEQWTSPWYETPGAVEQKLIDIGFLPKPAMQIPTIAKQPPTYTHQGDAGADLYAANSLKLGKGDIISVPTGVRVAIPTGYVGLIQPRSSMSAKGILAATGVIDSGYRGEVKVTLINLSGASTMIMPGDRVAQLLLIPVARAEFVAVEELPGSERGVNGFGSSGR